MSIKSQLISVASLSILDKFIKFIFLIILSRIFTPTEFGIIAAASFVVGFAELFSNIGFGTCLVQLKSINASLIRTALTMSVIMSIIISVVFFSFGSFIARWVNIPELHEIISYLSFIIILRGLSSISGALLQREMQAEKIIWGSIISYLINIVGITLPLAYIGFGYWALLYGMLAESITFSLGLYFLTRHSLKPLLAPSAVKQLLSKGFGFFLTRTLTYFALNLDYLIVSRYLGALSLGLYTRAYRIIEYPSVIYRMAIERVIFPMFSQQQDNTEYLRKAIIKGFFLTMVITAPLYAFIAANSSNIVLSVLGEQWHTAGQILSILATFGIFRVGFMVFSTYIKSLGLVKVSTAHALAFTFLVLICCSIGVSFGVHGVAIGAGCSVLLHCLFYSLHVAKLSHIPFRIFLNIYASSFFCFIWIYAPNVSINIFFSEQSAFINLIINGVLSCFLVLLLLTPSLKVVWGDVGIAIRQKLIKMLMKTIKSLKIRLVSKHLKIKTHLR